MGTLTLRSVTIPLVAAAVFAAVIVGGLVGAPALSAGAAAPTGATPHLVAVPPTSTLYVGESVGAGPEPAQPGGIGVFDPTDLAKGATALLPPLPPPSGDNGFASAVLVGTTLVGLDGGGLAIRRFNTLTGAITDQPINRPSQSGPVTSLVASPDGAALYLVGTDGSPIQVTEMNTFNWTVTTTYDIPAPVSPSTTSFPTVDPDTGDVWIPLDSGVVVVDPSNWTSRVLLSSTPTGQVAFDGGDAWVPAGISLDASSLVEIDTSDFATVRSIPLNGGVGSSVASPGGADVYATVAESLGTKGDAFEVLAVSASTGRVTSVGSVANSGIPLPQRSPMAVSADGTTVFIASNVNSIEPSGGDSTVTTLDTTTNTLTGDVGRLASGSGLATDAQLVTALVPVPSSPYPTQGYWQVATDGGVFSFGNATFHGSMGGTPLNQPIVGITAGPGDQGYWEVAADGGIFAFGSAPFYGSMGGTPLNEPVVGIASTPDRKGYWMVASDGGVFAFGDAAFHGSMGGQHLNQPIVGIAATPDGGGYVEVAADGGVFAFGDAAFHGSMGGQPLTRPVVGIATDPATGGYRMVASDGGIFSFDAPFLGSPVGTGLAQPVLGMASTTDGSGYWVLGTGGTLEGFGSAGNYGSMGGMPLNRPMVGMGTTGRVIS